MFNKLLVLCFAGFLSTTLSLHASVWDKMYFDHDVDVQTLVPLLKQESEETLLSAFESFVEKYDINKTITLAAVILEQYPHNQPAIEKHIQKKQSDLIEWYLENTTRWIQFENTPFSFNAMVVNVLTTFAIEKIERIRALEMILNNINQLPHYQEQVLEAMCPIVFYNPYLLPNYLSLLKIENRDFKKRFFHHLLESINTNDYKRNSYPLCSCISELFKDHQKSLMDYGVGACRELYESFKKKQAGNLLCMLWRFMEGVEDIVFHYKLYAREQMLDFWEIDLRDVPSEAATWQYVPWNTFNQSTIEIALRKKSDIESKALILKINAFLESMRGNAWLTDLKLQELFSTTFFTTVNESIVFNEEVELKERVQAFNRLIETPEHQQLLPEFKTRIESAIHNSLLQNYALHVYALSNPPYTTFEMCQHQRAISALITERSDIPWSRSLTPYCMYDQFSENSNPFFKTLNSTWSLSLQPSLDPESPFLYGFDEASRHSNSKLNFFVCTADDGNALWFAQFNAQRKSCYGVAEQPYHCSTTKERVYLNVSGTVAIIEKFTGKIISELSPSEETTIQNTYDNDNGTCFLLAKNKNNYKLIGLNTSNFSEQSFEIPFLDQRCIMRSSGLDIIIQNTCDREGILKIIDDKGIQQIVSYCSEGIDKKDRLWLHPRFASHDDFFYYQEYLTEKTGSLVQYNKRTQTRASEIILSTLVKRYLEISHDGARIVYIDSSKHLVSMQTSPLAILWRVNIGGIWFDTIDTFLISPTNNSVYGLGSDYLCIYNSDTGAEKQKIKVELGRGKALVGIIPGTETAIIAPYSY